MKKYSEFLDYEQQIERIISKGIKIRMGFPENLEDVYDIVYKKKSGNGL